MKIHERKYSIKQLSGNWSLENNKIIYLIIIKIISKVEISKEILSKNQLLIMKGWPTMSKAGGIPKYCW